MKRDRGFYDSNILIVYLFKEENRFDMARKVLEKHSVRAISIISIHELHMYSVKLGVEDRFTKVQRSSI